MLVRSACLAVAIALLPLAAVNALAQERPKVEIVSQLGHSDLIEAVALSADGGRALSGSLDSTLKLWDVNSGRLLRTFGGHTNGVNAVAFSPVDARILSGSMDKTLKLWDAATGQALRSFAGHTDFVKSAAFSPDGSKIVSGSADNTLKLWDASSGQLLRTFKGHSDSVDAVAFSPDGNKVLSGSSDKTLKLWDAGSGQLLRTLSGHTREVASVAFSPDGGKLVSGSGDNTVRIWDAATGASLRTLQGHINTPDTIVFSPDGRRILSGSSDWTLKTWDVATGQLLRSDRGEGNIASVALSADGRRTLVGGGTMLELRDVATGTTLRTFGAKLSSVVAVTLSPDGSRIISGSNDNSLRLWDAATGRLLRTSSVSDSVVSVAFSPDGSKIASASAGSEDPPRPDKLELWDAATGKLLRNFSGDLNAVILVKFSPDGGSLLTAGAYDSDTALQLWDAATGKLRRSFKTTDGVFSAAFSPDGKQVASSSSQMLQVWNAATGKLLRTIKTSGAVNSVAFSPDGKILVSGSDEKLQSWDLASGKPLRSWELGKLTSVTFSPDGSRLLAGGWDNTIKELDPATGKLLRTLTGHSGKVNSLAYSRDGRSIVSGSDDGTVRIWSGAGTANVLAMFEGQRIVLTPAGFFDYDGDVRKFVHLVRGFEVMTLGQVHQSLFSPDLVRETLTGDPSGEVKRATEVVNLEKVIDSGPAPDVEIISPPPGGTATADLVSVSARIRDRGKGIGRIEWRVNGITAGVCQTACLGPNHEVRRQLALDPGENVIEVVAYNAGDILASIPAQVAVTYAGPSDPQPPKLHVLAVGINDYVDRGGIAPGETTARHFPKLQLAVGDARAVAAEFKKAGEGIYRDVRVRTVLDEEATAARLDAAVTEFAGDIPPRDTFILYIAAHAITSSGRFYLIPQDYQGGGDPEALKTRAIDQLRMQDWIANRVRAKKVVVLLDTCESGALTNGYLRSRVDGPAADASIGRLHEATGRPVLTAAAQGQEAAELRDLEHGIFTAALLDGLRHAKTAPGGVIMLSSLAAYVQDAVPKLVKDFNEREGIVSRGQAGGEQSARFGSRGEDFALVRQVQ